MPGSLRDSVLLAARDALKQIGVGNDHAKPGDVIISREARALIAELVQGEEVPDGARRVLRRAAL